MKLVAVSVVGEAGDARPKGIGGRLEDGPRSFKGRGAFDVVRRSLYPQLEHTFDLEPDPGA
jgi:hypothetical protein